jgi:dihydrofolate reductase
MLPNCRSPSIWVPEVFSAALSISPCLLRRDRDGSTSEATLSKLKVSAFSVSIDGYGAGPDQSLQNPLGVGGEALHEWAFPTRTFQRMFGNASGTLGVDEDFAARSFANVGAWILGRNMFGPVRGRGPTTMEGLVGRRAALPRAVFVLTHHPRAPLADAGRHHFPLRHRRHPRGAGRAREAAAGKDVRIGGGVRPCASTCAPA